MDRYIVRSIIICCKGNIFLRITQINYEKLYYNILCIRVKIAVCLVYLPYIYRISIVYLTYMVRDCRYNIKEKMNDVKESILKAARPRMQQVGIRSVSIDDLCKELGISKKTFYVYFPSKDELVSEILHVHEQKMTREVQHLVADKTVVQCIID